MGNFLKKNPIEMSEKQFLWEKMQKSVLKTGKNYFLWSEFQEFFP